MLSERSSLCISSFLINAFKGLQLIALGLEIYCSNIKEQKKRYIEFILESSIIYWGSLNKIREKLEIIRRILKKERWKIKIIEKIIRRKNIIRLRKREIRKREDYRKKWKNKKKVRIIKNLKIKLNKLLKKLILLLNNIKINL